MFSNLVAALLIMLNSDIFTFSLDIDEPDHSKSIKVIAFGLLTLSSILTNGILRSVLKAKANFEPQDENNPSEWNISFRALFGISGVVMVLVSNLVALHFGVLSIHIVTPLTWIAIPGLVILSNPRLLQHSTQLFLYFICQPFLSFKQSFKLFSRLIYNQVEPNPIIVEVMV